MPPKNSQSNLEKALMKRHDKADKPKIMVLDVSNGITSSDNQYNIRRGEYILMHYFPSEMQESHNPQWNVQPVKKRLTPLFTWEDNHTRKISFSMLFNELGEDFQFDEIKNGFRKGLLHVSDSLQFLRDLARPVVTEGITPLAPPLIAIFGLFDLEIFIGFVENLNINVTHWSKAKNQVSATGKTAAGGGKFSQYNRALTDLEALPSFAIGWGAVPIRAKVDITIREGFREVVFNSNKQRKQTGK